MKRKYMKPTIRIVKLNQRCHILAGSNRSVSGLNKNSTDAEGITWKEGGFTGTEEDF